MEWIIIIGLGCFFYNITENIYAAVALDIAAVGTFVYLAERYSGRKAIGIIAVIVFTVFGIVKTNDIVKSSAAQKAHEAEERQMAETESRVRAFAETNMHEKWDEYNAAKQNMGKFRRALNDIIDGNHSEWFVKAVQNVQAQNPGADKEFVKSKAIDYLKTMDSQYRTQRKELLNEIARALETYEIKRRKSVAESEARSREIAKAINESKRIENERNNKIRDFAMQEASQMWQTYENLGVEIESLSSKIGKLRESLLAFEIDPEKDDDYARLVSMRENIVKSRDVLHQKMKDAYIASCKFAAIPNSKEFDQLRRRTIEDGIREAELAEERYRTMSREK